ncbi:hypothetical protein WKT22_05286 [Candidatus Lokiarchaeum ossiferum]
MLIKKLGLILLMTTSPTLDQGLIHYYYGKGCGKTSITIGHIVRSIGRNFRPVLLQFLKKHDPSGQKGFYYGEYVALTEKLGVPIFQYGDFNFIRSDKQIANQKKNALEGLNKIQEVITSSDYDLVILDEIGSMIKVGLYESSQIVEILRKKSSTVEIIMTGHEKIPEFEVIANYVTHLQEIKHPFQEGIFARAGIEF